MASPTALNSQITDAISQANTKVLAEAPAMALGNLYESSAASLAIASMNATSNQQQGNILAEAIITRLVDSLVGGKPSSPSKK